MMSRKTMADLIESAKTDADGTTAGSAPAAAGGEAMITERQSLAAAGTSANAEVPSDSQALTVEPSIVPLPNGSLFMTMTPERREKVEEALGVLQGGLIWASLEYSIHKVVVAYAMTKTLVWAVADCGHADIARALDTMFGTVFVWPEDKRGEELAEQQATAIVRVIGDAIQRIGGVAGSPDEAQIVMLNVFANATVSLMADAWGEEAGDYVKQKLETAQNWSLAKGMGDTQGGLN